MKNRCRCRPPAAYPESKPLPIWGLARRFLIALGRPQSAWDVGGYMTELTSIPGSTSIRVEGGP
jgi:hypothetical protein